MESDAGSFSTLILPCVFSGEMKRFIDIRTLYANAYANGKRTNLTGMLLGLGMKFEGRMHSGIADTNNITRVLLRFLEDGHAVVSTRGGGGGGKAGT